MSAAAFSLLHPGVQRAIFKQGWKELHHIQAETIQILLQGEGHLLVCAQTAAGKTEAAFLPILSRLAETPQPSVQALYIGPLIALINDQFGRLETLCDELDVPVHRWHGAASTTEKRRFRETPGGVLLITPESLESNFINYGNQIARIYADLEFIVIDELHSFLSDVRGVHLRSLLARLAAKTGRKPRMVGLSATLGDPSGARAFLSPEAPESVHIITGTGEQAVKFGIKAFLRRVEVAENKTERRTPQEALDATMRIEIAQASKDQPLVEHKAIPPVKDSASDELDEIAGDILQTCAEGTNLIFGNAKQGLEILADRLHDLVRSSGLRRDPFHVHHGSLSKDVREDVEALLKSGQPTTVFCSSTLEMGIDIGAIRRIAQLDPPWTVSSMRQRLGRSGRRPGESAIMRIYARDDSPYARSSLTDLLFPHLVRSIALTRLMLSKWLEPHDSGRLELSTLVHQILSCLRETGGLSAKALFRVLVERGAFRNVAERMFLAVLRSLSTQKLIEQMPTGEIILAPLGERLTSERDFYAAFASSDEYTVRHDSDEIGKLQSNLIPPEGENIILGGRRWVVVSIDTKAKIVLVQPTRARKPPLFLGTAGEIHTRVAEEMAATLADRDEPRFLDESAQTLLKAARAMATKTGVLNPGWIVREKSIQWYPWLGTRGLATLELHARCEGLAIECDRLSVTYRGIDFARWQAHLQSIVRDERGALTLAQRMAAKTREKFDGFLSEELLDEMNAYGRLDLPGARLRAEQALANPTLAMPG